ncbi:hypothetical protein ONZ43_g6112 [Nemania bipapillata]|uniref:Uncharacterized protein n=1 Tax=Nemania bipapillata TaxID=110536 RepID=A0ACC2I3Q4_9PEZI|nr:hypothetical protein ONZ43_g6112 [Nemania bipapillata]
MDEKGKAVADATASDDAVAAKDLVVKAKIEDEGSDNGAAQELTAESTKETEVQEPINNNNNNNEALDEDNAQAPEDNAQAPEDNAQAPEDNAQAPEDNAQAPEDNAQAPEERFPCDHCSKVFDKKRTLSTHKLDRHVGTQCRWPECGYTTNNEVHLLNHLREHQRIAVGQGFDKKTCPWPGCEKVYSRSDSVQRCFKRHNARA